MLGALGMFVFSTDSALFDELLRRRAWRHARTDRFGAPPAGQFLGPGEDAITLSGTIVPEIAGAYSSIERLAEMAKDGDAHTLADGLGNVFGQYTIESLEERQGTLTDQGRPRVTGFTIELQRAG